MKNFINNGKYKKVFFVLSCLLFLSTIVFGIEASVLSNHQKELNNEKIVLKKQLKSTDKELKETEEEFKNYKNDTNIYLDYGDKAVKEIENYKEKEKALGSIDYITLSNKPEILELRKLYDSFDSQQKKLVKSSNLVGYENKIKVEAADKAAADKAAADKATADKAAADKAAADKATADKAAADKAAADKATADKAAADKATADKATADKAVGDKGGPDERYTNSQGSIVGNVNSKIYHVPGQAGYYMKSKNAVYFNTEEEAIAAGYHKAKR